MAATTARASRVSAAPSQSSSTSPSQPQARPPASEALWAMVWAADPARGAGQQAGSCVLRDTRASGPPGCRRWARDVPRPESCLAKEAVPAGAPRTRGPADPGGWASVEQGVRTTPRSSRSSGLPDPAPPPPPPLPLSAGPGADGSTRQHCPGSPATRSAQQTLSSGPSAELGPVSGALPGKSYPQGDVICSCSNTRRP